MKNLIPAFFAVGAVMSLAGALIYITKWPLAPYIFMVGSILVAIAQIFSPPKKSSVNIRRATGPLMIFLHGNEWIVSLTLAAIIELFTSIRLPQEEEKEKNQRSIDGH